MEVSVQPWSLYPGEKSPRYSLERRLGGPQSRCGRSGEEKQSSTVQREGQIKERRLKNCRKVHLQFQSNQTEADQHGGHVANSG